MRVGARVLQLRLLGAVRLVDSDGQDIAALLAQPKRLALLAYLALARPAGPQRRDTLLALFWPEQDASSARHSLSQALHFLRGSLGSEIIVTRGGEDVGVDAQQLECDALEFEKALARGDVENALRLYEGDLLTGFHLSDAPEFERWLDGERARLRAAAVQAAHEGTERAIAAGRKREAAMWAARAVALDPLNERAVRRLMRANDAAGDRAGALREYQNFARRVAVDLETEPAPETRALADAIRSRVNAMLLSSAEYPAMPGSAAQHAAAVAQPIPARRRLRWVVALAIVLVVLVWVVVGFSR